MLSPSPRPRLLRRAALPCDTVELARYLLGKLIIRTFDTHRLCGRIVETEAYTQDEPACHAFIGQTRRNRSLFLRRGHAYVYLCYGTSYMLNVTSGDAGEGSGVLLRGLEPVSGFAQLAGSGSGARGRRMSNLTDGPGKLARALRVDLSLDGVDMTQTGPLSLAQDGFAGAKIGTSVRIGITKAAHLERRFFLCDNQFVSRHRGARARSSASGSASSGKPLSDPAGPCG